MIQIIDNFLPLPLANQLSDIVSGAEFPWYYSPSIATSNQTSDLYYFTHTIYEGLTPKSQIFELVVPILERLEVKALIRAKANLFPNIGKYVEVDKHVDFAFNHIGAVYYINSNNGYTILSDGQKIESVSNRILIFDSSQLHQSTFCTDQKTRLNINLNFFQ